AQRDDGSAHGVFVTWTALNDLGTLGGASSAATGINRSGQVVGRALTSLGNSRAFLYTNGSLRSLGTLGGSQSAAYAINDVGDIVGSATTTGDAATRAFLYRNGTMVDLNTFLPAGSGWVLEAATAINSAGEIAGYGRIGGHRHAFRLTPPAQLRLDPFGALSNEDSNLPRNGVQAGRNVTFVTSITAGDGPARNLVFTDTMTGPITIQNIRT